MFYEAECYALEEPVRPTPPTGLTDPGDRSDRSLDEKTASAMVSSKIAEDEVDDWREPLIKYLRDPRSTANKKI